MGVKTPPSIGCRQTWHPASQRSRQRRSFWGFLFNSPGSARLCLGVEADGGGEENTTDVPREEAHTWRRRHWRLSWREGSSSEMRRERKWVRFAVSNLTLTQLRSELLVKCLRGAETEESRGLAWCSVSSHLSPSSQVTFLKEIVPKWHPKPLNSDQVWLQ